MPKYSITPATDVGDLAELRAFWEQHQSHPNADYEFYLLIVGVRENVLSPIVFVVREEEKIVALFVGRLEETQMRYRIAYSTIAKVKARQLVIIDGGCIGDPSEEIWRLFYRYVDQYLVEKAIDYACFSQVPKPSIRYTMGKISLSRLRYCQVKTASEHWLLRLPKTMDDFLRSRNRKHRYWIKRLRSVLDRDFPEQWVVRRFMSVAEAEEFGVFAEAVSKTTYHRSLGAGFKWTEEGRRRLRLEASKGRLRGYVLFIGGEPKAFWHCLLYRDSLLLCSTGYIASFRQYELGTVLLLNVFEDHCGVPGLVVDFGLGDAGYKQRYGSEHYLEVSTILFARSARGFGLRIGHAAFEGTASFAKAVVDHIGITQRIKTALRNLLGKKNNT